MELRMHREPGRVGRKRCHGGANGRRGQGGALAERLNGTWVPRGTAEQRGRQIRVTSTAQKPKEELLAHRG